MRAIGWLAGVALLALSPGDQVAAQATKPRGHLFIVGGGGQSDSLVRRFVALAGGPGKARIAVIPLASSEPMATGDEKAAQLRGFGAEAVVWVPTRAEANDPSWARRVDSVTGVWFTGGDQTLILNAIGGTALATALRARYRAGAVVGGTSAGAAIMPDSMITGNQRTPDSLGYFGDTYSDLVRGRIEIVPGLGFLPGTLIDQHFVRRERHNRLLSVVLERPTMLGAGIDEGTALEVGPDGIWNVIGIGSVSIYDARNAQIGQRSTELLGGANLILHVLPPGSVFDPHNGVLRVGVP